MADGPAMLAAPLSMQATLLSQPSPYPSLGPMPEITEEGDILHAVLGDPWTRLPLRPLRSTCQDAGGETHRSSVDTSVTAVKTEESDESSGAGVAAAQPFAAAASQQQQLWRCVAVSTTPSSTALCFQGALILPRKIGPSLTKEKFRALLSFYNAATYPLSAARLLVTMTHPPPPPPPLQQQQQKATLVRRAISALPAKSTYVYIAEVLLMEAGAHTLAVSVEYTDPSRRQRQLTWSSSFTVEAPVMEAVPRQLYCQKPWRLDSTEKHFVYALTLGLRNMSSVPVLLQDTSLQLPSIKQNGETVFELLPPPDTKQHYDSVSARLMPDDTYLRTFYIGVLRREHRPATVRHVQGGLSTRLLPPRLASFGHAEWRWTRENGESGSMESAPLLIDRLPALPEIEMAVLEVRHGQSMQTVGHGVPFRAGSPVALHCVARNHSDIHRYDLAVKIRVERLAPSWLCMGPTLRPLGLLEPQESIPFELELLPWQSGQLTVVREAIELVDARAPASSLLWPAPLSMLESPPTGAVVTERSVSRTGVQAGVVVTGTSTTGGGGAAAAAASSSQQGTLPAVAEQRMQGRWPPAATASICDVLVM